MAEGLDSSSIRAFDVCKKPVIAISIYVDVDNAVETMTDYGIRRLVVLDGRTGL